MRAAQGSQSHNLSAFLNRMLYVPLHFVMVSAKSCALKNSFPPYLCNHSEAFLQHLSFFFRGNQMSTIVSGCLFGLREFCRVPLGLWRMHKQIKNASSSSRYRGLIADSLMQPYYDQALRRQKISAAIGGRRGSPSQITESPHRSSLEHSSLAYPYVNILNLFGLIWLLNVLVVFVNAILRFYPQLPLFHCLVLKIALSCNHYLLVVMVNCLISVDNDTHLQVLDCWSSDLTKSAINNDTKVSVVCFAFSYCLISKVAPNFWSKPPPHLCEIPWLVVYSFWFMLKVKETRTRQTSGPQKCAWLTEVLIVVSIIVVLLAAFWSCKQ